MKNDGELLETDARGRVRVSRERREALLDEYEKSGLSGARFARVAGLCYTTFTSWRQKRRQARLRKCDATAEAPKTGPQSSGTPVPIRLLEASVESNSSAMAGRLPMPAALTVELSGGARIRIESPVQLPLAAELIVLTSQFHRRPC